MKQNTIKNSQNDMQALFAELEARFGTKKAEEIIDQVQMARSGQSKPGYMIVKTYSEMLELFRGEAQSILTQLRHGKEKWSGEGSKISFLDKRKLEAEFRRVYRLYWISMKLFYPMYDQAMASYQKKLNAPFTSTPHTTEMKMAA